MFESDTLLFLFYYVCVSQSSFYMNFKLNELFYNIFLMFNNKIPKNDSNTEKIICQTD